MRRSFRADGRSLKPLAIGAIIFCIWRGHSPSSFAALHKPSGVTGLAKPLEVEVAIAGGGLGGLALCAALRARGIDAHVFEAAPQLLRGSTGTGIMISANGWAALASVDPAIPPLMRDRGVRITRQTIHISDASGVIRRNMSFDTTHYKDTYGAHQYNIGWARAHEVLASVVPAVAVHTGHALKSYSLTEQGNAVDIVFESRKSVRASLLVGSDGVNSTVRRLVAGTSACESRYSGQFLWNAIVDSAKIPQAHADGEVEFVTCGVDGKAILAFDAGEGKTSWYLTIMMEDAPLGMREALASGAFDGFGHVGVVAELEKLFAAWPLALDCLRATPEAQIFGRRLADRAPLKQWADESANGGGRVVLIGDAAHPMIPSQGQGTMLTWEDAADLAALVKLKGTDSGLSSGIPAAVSEFVKRRAKRCSRVQRFSAEGYMGRPAPSMLGVMKILMSTAVRKLLGIQSQFAYMYSGYEALES